MVLLSLECPHLEQGHGPVVPGMSSLRAGHGPVVQTPGMSSLRAGTWSCCLDAWNVLI